MFRCIAIGGILLMGASQVGIAGPDVIEDTIFDAGGLVGTSQDTTVSFVGQPTSITGRLRGTANQKEPDDYVDAFLITITTPTAFLARTFEPVVASQMGVPSGFDTQLWLFDASGFGLLANDDKGIADTGSLITPPSTDGTLISIPGPGTYLLAISVQGVFPLSGIGSIFDLTASATEISGPDGVGGAGALSSWDETSPGVAVPGDYYIEIIPAPSVVAMTGPGMLLFIRRRR